MKRKWMDELLVEDLAKKNWWTVTTTLAGWIGKDASHPTRHTLRVPLLSECTFTFRDYRKVHKCDTWQRVVFLQKNIVGSKPDSLKMKTSLFSSLFCFTPSYIFY